MSSHNWEVLHCSSQARPGHHHTDERWSLQRELTCTEPCARPTVPGLWGPFSGRGLEVIWWDASVIAYACRQHLMSHTMLQQVLLLPQLAISGPHSPLTADS